MIFGLKCNVSYSCMSILFERSRGGKASENRGWRSFGLATLEKLVLEDLPAP